MIFRNNADTLFMKLISLFILIFVGEVLACEVREIAPSVEGMQEMPDVSRGFVAWINDHRAFGFDVRTNTTFPIDLDRYSSEVIADFPFVFWIGFDEDSQIYYCDLRRNGRRGGCFEDDEKHAITNYLSLKRNIDFFHNVLAWQDNSYGNWDVAVCDMRDNGNVGGCLANDPKRFITSDVHDQINPSVGTGFIAWEDYRLGTADIFGFNFRKDAEIPLVVERDRQYNPVVRGRNVFFGDNHDGNEEVKRTFFFYRRIVNLTNSRFDEVNHDVDDGLMVYETSVHGGSSIGIKNLGRNVTSVLRLNDREYHPKTSEGVVVFESVVNGMSRVYLARC